MNIVYLIPEKVNINTHDLSSGENLLLWSMRTWVMGFMRKINVKDDLRRAYQHYNTSDSITELDHFLYALSFGARRKIDIHCPLRGSVSPDELTLLNILANYQVGQLSFANCMMRKYCSDQTLMQARFHAIEFTQQIKEQGNIILSSHPLRQPANPPEKTDILTLHKKSWAV